MALAAFGDAKNADADISAAVGRILATPDLNAAPKAALRDTGIGVLCNTSLNLQRRGLINSMSDLASNCQDRGIDDMVVGGTAHATHCEATMQPLPKHPRLPNVRPMVSVIIPTLDRPALLDAALGSVASQSMRSHAEVIVVNDGGLPVTPVIEAWKDTLAIKLIEADRRSGTAAARNAAIEQANGEFLAFLDDDDLFLPDHLDAGCGRLRNGDAEFVYLGAIVSDHRLAGRPQDLTGFRLKAYPYDHRFLLVANYLHTGSVIVRNFKDTPVRFDESLDVCEDWDLWLALTIQLGYRVASLDKITSVYHQVPDLSGLVAEAQMVSPSKFSLARNYINAKWPADDPLAHGYRDWMAELERFRDDLIAGQRRMPTLLFDEILSYLHVRISAHEPPDFADISRFFAPCAAAVANAA